MNSWALQDAKAKFSALVERAHSAGPQMVTRRSKVAVVVLAAAQFQELTRRHRGQDLVRFFRESPLKGLPPDWLSREDDAGREIAL